MNDNTIRIRCVGDLILDVEDNLSYFAKDTQEAMRNCDLGIGQVEVAHTDRGTWSNPEASSAPPSKPENLDILPGLGINVATLAGNHIFDQGTYGVLDTMDYLDKLGIVNVGAGKNLEAARKPAFKDVKGKKFAFLSYNTVGPSVSWATPLKAGCAFLKVSTHYESDKAEPGGQPTNIYTITDPACLSAMEDDIKKAKAAADYVIVAFHMGRMFSSKILTYQTEICHKAIDAGASAILCCHAHQLLGTELYKDCPIYYGLGHFVVVSGVGVPDSWVRPQHSFRPFNDPSTVPYWPLPVGEYSPNRTYYIFNDESRMTMIADMKIDEKGNIKSGFVPCYIVGDGIVETRNKENGGEEIRAYMQRISDENNLGSEFVWNEDGSLILINAK